MYCKCKNPKKITSEANGEKFFVCSRNGGCGKEIGVDLDPKFVPLILGHYSLPPLPYQEAVEEVPCPRCEGAGFFAALYPSGHTEVTCDCCYGNGYI